MTSQIGVGMSITLPYNRIGVSGATAGDPDPAAPGHDLLWGDGNGITWASETVMDWPVI